MRGAAIYRRKLNRSSAHRQSLLRNLVQSLIQHESISTTFAKAKEAQRVAEKLITLGKKNTNASYSRAQSFLHEPDRFLPKVFGQLAKRYAERPGGYTRVLLQESMKKDQAKSAVLSLVDGPKDMRFSMTALALRREWEENLPRHPLTEVNVRKVTRFRKGGMEALEKEVQHLTDKKERYEKQDREDWEKEGTRWIWTNEVPRSDPRWRELMGPGTLVKRKIKKDEFADLGYQE